MSGQTKISWSGATWNPVVGCSKISPGCANCYACRDGRRMGANPNPKVSQVYGGLVTVNPNGILDWTGTVRQVPERLQIPLSWRKRKRIFVNSQSDLFHEVVSDEFIGDVFQVMRRAHWHTFQVLTKRAERLPEVDSFIDWPPNSWIGVSVESQDYCFRIDLLRRTKAMVKFVSVEPLLGPISDLCLDGIDWVIVGGESGPRARKMNLAWAYDIVEGCRKQGVSCFVKQLGKCWAFANGAKDKKGADPGEWPLDLRIQEFPKTSRVNSRRTERLSAVGV